MVLLSFGLLLLQCCPSAVVANFIIRGTPTSWHSWQSGEHIHTIHLFTHLSKLIFSLNNLVFSFPFTIGRPWNDGQLTCNYCNQTTPSNWLVISTINQIGKRGKSPENPPLPVSPSFTPVAHHPLGPKVNF